MILWMIVEFIGEKLFFVISFFRVFGFSCFRYCSSTLSLKEVEIACRVYLFSFQISCLCG